jgi:hypothetical protein
MRPISLSLPLPLSVSLPVPRDRSWTTHSYPPNPTYIYIEAVTVCAGCVCLCVLSTRYITRSIATVIAIVVATVAVMLPLTVSRSLPLSLGVLQTSRHLVPGMTPVPHTVETIPSVPITPRHSTLPARKGMGTAIQTISVILGVVI